MQHVEKEAPDELELSDPHRECCINSVEWLPLMRLISFCTGRLPDDICT
jgi:hypothetical protein